MLDALDVTRAFEPVPPGLPGACTQDQRAADGHACKACPDNDSTEITLAAGDVLFKEGDIRLSAYRVVSGVLRHTVRLSDGPEDVFEFAFPGDVIGLGFLTRHVTAAEAMLETRVSLVPMHELERQARVNDAMESKLAAAVNIEFAVLRDRAIRAGAGKPVERIGAYLLAAASLGESEGGGGMVWDALPSGYVASSLGMTIDGLAASLKVLQDNGLIERVEGGVLIPNALALAVFSEPAFATA